MKPTDEPKSLLEVREWKAKVSAQIERLGFEAYSAQSKERHRDFWKEIEKIRLAKKPKAV
jgi:hypothetical protein